MERTNTYINQFTPSNQRISFRERVSSFIDQHAGVFQALTRQGLPYGGNWLPAAQPDSFQPVELNAETMIEVERELDNIILRLAQLSNSLQAGSTQGQAGKWSVERAGEIGIERFRSLQVEV